MRTLPLRSAPLLAAAALAAVPAFASADPHATAARTRSVTVRGLAFHPGTLRIHRGDRVRWRFRDGGTAHTVHSVGRRRFRSTGAHTRGSYTVRFRHRGTYRYVCAIHPFMHGRIVVR